MVQIMKQGCRADGFRYCFALGYLKFGLCAEKYLSELDFMLYGLL